MDELEGESPSGGLTALRAVGAVSRVGNPDSKSSSQAGKGPKKGAQGCGLQSEGKTGGKLERREPGGGERTCGKFRSV